jgi:ATP-dependent DNA helicase Rep
MRLGTPLPTAPFGGPCNFSEGPFSEGPRKHGPLPVSAAGARGLNPQQLAAVRHLDGPLLVLAGAGSGKTRVITQKIAYLIQECGIAPRHVAAVTFTNKAAREMRARVGALLRDRDSRGLRVSTFHTLGLDFLRREGKALGLRAGFTIFDAEDCVALLREINQRQRSSTDEAARLASGISRWKAELIDPAEALRRAADEPGAVAARAYAEYERRLRAYNAVDFDDLIGLPVQALEAEPRVLDRWQDGIRYLLVDEYQDTNLAQYRLVKALVGLRQALTAVGDDDQSIYAWRGARPDNLAALARDFPRLEVVKLEQNYRSCGHILQAANALIANNPHLYTKSLWTGLGPGAPIRVLRAKDETHEAEWVVSELLSHHFKHRTRFGDYAVLYRGNHQARAFERLLREHRVPYFLSGGTSFFAKAEVRDLMAYLRLLVNPDDDAAFLRVVNVPRREIGPTTLERLSAYAGGRRVSLFAACLEMGLAHHVPPPAADRLQRFAEWLLQLASRSSEGAPAETLRALIRATDYLGWLDETSKDSGAAGRRQDAVDELVSWVERLATDGSEAPGRDLNEVVGRMALLDILERQDEENDADRVSLMTLHAAKGLEFPHVFLVGLEEGALPHHSGQEGPALEEERRLAYVGITRARHTLTLSYAGRRRRGGELQTREPSRFLAELPAAELDWQGGEAPQCPLERQARGRAELEKLRALVSAGGS